VYFYTVLLNIDSLSGVPIHLQIENQLRNSIAFGGMKPGDCLPSVRKLAANLRINPNTVARAYKALREQGVVTTTQGRGTYVKAGACSLPKSASSRRLRQYARQLVIEGMQLRLSDKDIVDILQKELAALNVKR
jgi:GntR family transcriptional regulator